MQTIEMHLSEKQSILSQFIFAFFESALNFQNFQDNMILIAYVFTKLPSTKDVLRQMSKNSRLRGPLDTRHGKRAENLIQS